ncbi:hypothetical protein HZH68_015508 [Vespula germanica]|uniref:Uncharacterized protein n=1 Tax=Vespula germanica TaxID=30212 RepID=A0A834J8X3_VESGE|nr:hypothetical protein HZH68_015508 [Vespula germanica]
MKRNKEQIEIQYILLRTIHHFSEYLKSREITKENAWTENTWASLLEFRLAMLKASENVERVRVLINQNYLLTVQVIEEDLGIPKTIISEFLVKIWG